MYAIDVDVRTNTRVCVLCSFKPVLQLCHFDWAARCIPGATPRHQPYPNLATPQYYASNVLLTSLGHPPSSPPCGHTSILTSQADGQLPSVLTSAYMTDLLYCVCLGDSSVY